MIELPKIMRTMERDARGFPIPFIVMRDKTGFAHFNINDSRRVETALAKRLCSICGKRLEKLVWFVGGTLCFTSDRAAFLDPPMHQECAEFALAVCPFLAAPRYTRSIGQRRVNRELMPGNMALNNVAYNGPMRPEWFAMGGCFAFKRVRPDRANIGHSIFVPLDWQMVEFWRHGNPTNAPERAEIEHLERLAA